MPRYRVRAESPDAKRGDGEPHFRETTLLADDEDAARRRVERREMATAAHEYPPAALAELEAQEAGALAASAAARDAARGAAEDYARDAGLDDAAVAAAGTVAADAIPDGRPSATVAMQLASHRQQHPYVVVSVDEIPDREE